MALISRAHIYSTLSVAACCYLSKSWNNEATTTTTTTTSTSSRGEYEKKRGGRRRGSRKRDRIIQNIYNVVLGALLKAFTFKQTHSVFLSFWCSLSLTTLPTRNLNLPLCSEWLITVGRLPSLSLSHSTLHDQL